MIINALRLESPNEAVAISDPVCPTSLELCVTSTAGRRWKSFILLYAVDLYVRDPIGIIFWMEGTDGGTD